MQQDDDVEVQFCDLCGTSVPLADLESGAAVRHQAKTIGACCLGVLRKGESPLVSPGLPAAADRPARRRAEFGLLPMAIALALVVFGATIYLDLALQAVDEQLQEFRSEVTEARQSDSDVLRALDQGMDGVARKADLDGLRERLVALGDALELQRENQSLQLEQVRQGLAGLAKDIARLGEQRIDYRPLFDDLRQQVQRQLSELSALRAEGAAERSAPDPGEVAEEPAPEVDPGLPPDLAEQVARLADGDAAVRFEAVDLLLVSRNLLVLPHLVAMTQDPDGFVRRLTVEGLRDFRHPDAVEALLAALGDSDDIVADTAWNSLKRLTGQKLPFDAKATSKDVRRRQRERWQEWWEANKDGFKD